MINLRLPIIACSRVPNFGTRGGYLTVIVTYVLALYVLALYVLVLYVLALYVDIVYVYVVHMIRIR